MKKLIALLLIMLGSLNASLAGASANDCCSSEVQESSLQSDIGASHDCSSPDQGLCSGCGFLGHCAVALQAPAIQIPYLLSSVACVTPQAFAPDCEPASFLDPPIS